MARVRAGIINWLGEGIPSSNIKSSLNRTELSSKTIVQLEPWSGEIHQRNPEVLDTGNWPQTQQLD